MESFPVSIHIHRSTVLSELMNPTTYIDHYHGHHTVIRISTLIPQPCLKMSASEAIPQRSNLSA
ncbi:uncharacterized protein LACBIDRAFT_303390 [Laccaria bicolor S238N-H82]|uniref:Predicted protein n=1 Tax=Laccaria bicolor (strain S238N-H82 / ATCC MYA-4686) TaxID=486041 RepID=B0E467_LACBS|nr:uncharacterized protein LACBIDRAFT_303390 [Laccaria bicolor S238N-H82]EDQ98363.1 predicted protein [Laccaria bicolor S238N-H82]|eukprot:XP_001890984.1 predicted protein [Laccaria bicolor S238N-H82]